MIIIKYFLRVFISNQKTLFILCYLASIYIICNCKEQTIKSFHVNGKDIPLINYNIPLTRLVDSLNLNEKLFKVSISKAKYILEIRSGNRIVKSYPVVFGFNPVEDKLAEGDGCTPEGKFKIRAKYPHKSWSKFIWIDYPNKSSWQKHQIAITTGIIPKNSKIGGSVGIHGVPKDADYLIDQKQNWTLGCISLKNKDINEIYDFVLSTTEIIITH
jgi:murein L,D-transpeptidase YafK